MTSPKSREEQAKEYAAQSKTGVPYNASYLGFLAGHASRDAELAAKDARIAELEAELKHKCSVAQEWFERFNKSQDLLAQAVAALDGVVVVADPNTEEYDRVQEALAKLKAAGFGGKP